MSEEEKKAIEDLRKILFGYEQANECGLSNNDFKGDIKTIVTILNLIQKQQEEIKHLKNLNKHQSKDITKAVNYIFELNKELEKKDKIIDELEDIFNNYQLCEYEITDCTYRKCEYIGDDETPPCKDCIKQYFEKKVEE